MWFFEINTFRMIFLFHISLVNIYQDLLINVSKPLYCGPFSALFCYVTLFSIL